MTKYERLSTILSVLALGCAIAAPFISYRWLDPQLQSFRNRAKLQVSLEEPKWFGHGLDYSDANYSIITSTRGHEIKIVNVGELPAKDVFVTAQFLESQEASLAPTISPPTPIEMSTKDYVQFVALKRPIAPHDTILVSFRSSPKVIWVSTEYGETSTLITGTQAFRVDNKTNELTPLDAIPPKPSPSPSVNAK